MVLGIGEETAEIMIIGDSPSYHDDKEGYPFTSEAGKYLMQLLAIVDITKDNSFITNVVKCKPPRNRDPHPTEIDTCINNYLGQEIQYINPIFIITVGKIATNVMLGDIIMKNIVGNYYKVDDRFVIPIYHPSYILRNTNFKDDYTELIRYVRQTISTIMYEKAFDISAIFNKQIKSPF